MKSGEPEGISDSLCSALLSGRIRVTVISGASPRRSAVTARGGRDGGTGAPVATRPRQQSSYTTGLGRACVTEAQGSSGTETPCQCLVEDSWGGTGDDTGGLAALWQRCPSPLVDFLRRRRRLPMFLDGEFFKVQQD